MSAGTVYGDRVLVLDLGGTTPAVASTAVLATGLEPVHQYSHALITASLVGATGGALDVYLQTSPDYGTTWFDVIHFPQLAAAASAVKYVAALGKFVTSAVPIVVGAATTPALAANVIFPSGFGTHFRTICVAGASTSAGAAVIITVTLTRL